MSANRRRCRPTSRTTSRPTPQPEPVEPFISCTGTELLALTPVDFDQLDDLQGEPDGLRTWWALRRLEWAEEEAER